MIDVKQATSVAMKTAADFFAEQKLYDLALEEVEMTDDNKFWLITLGFSTEENTPTDKADEIAGINQVLALINPQSQKYHRKYKTFKIDADTGKFRAMKIREV